MSNLEQALEACLSQLASGEATLEECLKRYPEHAAELRGLLTAAKYVERGRAVRPSAAFRARSRANLITHVNANSRQRATQHRPKLFPAGLRLAFGKAFSLTVSLAAILLLFLVTGSVLAQAASPGEPLYGWRVATEDVWRLLHPDPVEANLTLVERHAYDLKVVAGSDPHVEQLARQDYEDSLNELLPYYDEPSSQRIIQESLAEQKASFAEANIDVPELDRLIGKASVQKTRLSIRQQVAAVEAGRITYRLTITNHGPLSPVTTTVISRLSSGQRPVLAATDPMCQISAARHIQCTIANLSTEAPHNLTLTANVGPCYAGVVTNTTTVTGSDDVISHDDNQAVAEQQITLPFPGPARVVYVQSDEQRHNLVGAVTAGAPLLTDDLHEYAGAPAWSPDGRQLAFFGEQGISQLGADYRLGNGIWLMDMVNGQGQNLRQVVAQDHVKNMVWSPDGRKLAFEVGEPGMAHEIAVIDPQDGEQISRFRGEQPAWSPDSQRLIIKACDPGCGLWQINLDGSGAKQITFGDSDSYPAWSPDGQHLAFTSARDDNWEIYRLQLGDGQLVRLTDRPGSDITPVFGPCGQEIYLRTDYFGGWRITTMKLDGSDETTIVEGVGSTDEWGLARPAIH